MLVDKAYESYDIGFHELEAVDDILKAIYLKRNWLVPHTSPFENFIPKLSFISETIAKLYGAKNLKMQK